MEFNPEYKITHELLNNVRDFHKLITKLNAKKIPNSIYSQILKEGNAENIFNVLSLSSNNITLPQVKNLLGQDDKALGDNNIKEALNYYRALTGLQKMKKRNFDIELVRTLHKQVMKDLTSKKDTGTFRSYNTAFKNDKTGKVIYSPPNHKDVRETTKALMKFTSKNKDFIDPLILAGIFHKQFLVIAPFSDGNRRVCQLITRILLSNLNFNFLNLLNFEKQYKANPSKYLEEVSVPGNYYAIKNKIDLTNWLEYFTGIILIEAKRLGEKLEKQKSEVKISKDQEKVIKYIQRHGTINDGEYSKITERKKSTRVLDFNDLIEKGLIERKGKARQTYYVLRN